jgi:hypothetical protein
MNTLTLERLDEMAAWAKRGNMTLSGTDARALIEAARLQIAIDELPLPEGWQQPNIVTSSKGEWTAYTWEYRHPHSPTLKAVGPTMLEAVLALRDALAARPSTPPNGSAFSTRPYATSLRLRPHGRQWSWPSTLSPN